MMFILGAIFNRIRGGWIFSGFNRSINAIAFGIACGYFSTPLTGLYMILAMYAGQSLGWGRYIGALGGWETEELKEVKAIDWLIQKTKHNMRLWGFLGLTLRGLIWGVCLAIPVMNAMPIVAGASMGLVYMLTLSIADRKGWEYGEVLFGGILWYSIF